MSEQLRADARHNRDQIMVAARALFATHGVHVHWIEVRLGLVHTGICEELPALLTSNGELREARTEFFTLVDELVERAQADGELRTDVGGGDLALFANALVEQHDLPASVQDDVRSRMLELLLDGLRVRTAPPLPGAPRRMADLDVHVPTNEG
jgi:DNA-binding ferritin-like protein (Dps family)